MNDQLLKKFHSDGYVVIRNLFSSEEITDLRKAFNKMREYCVNNNLLNVQNDSPNLYLLKGDLCSYHQLRFLNYLVFEPRILSAVKKLIGEEIVYFGESNTQSGPTLGGFHKDNRVCDRENEAGLDFVGDYPLVRVGIYLQDSDIYSGGLKIVPGSHKMPTSKFRIGGNNIAAKAGDIVVWKLTTTHSGHAKRLKILNNISLHPRIESYIPSLLENINPIERMAMFIVYGAKSKHLERYIEYFKNREDYKDYLSYAGKTEYIDMLASKVNLQLVRPIADYGANQNLFEQLT